ncbi:DUF1499 domain-containing protein [Candidatus Accumulibacter sp. ACC003]|uniref:DUF1499 domain-containing protein n=1 Tax=Candidatus Accumulibacter sp. ACC003 TaxID=2823334 RepID=UPI00344E4EA0
MSAALASEGAANTLTDNLAKAIAPVCGKRSGRFTPLVRRIPHSTFRIPRSSQQRPSSKGTPTILTTSDTSPLLKFVDDVDFWFDPTTGVTQLRSASAARGATGLPLQDCAVQPGRSRYRVVSSSMVCARMQGKRPLLPPRPFLSLANRLLAVPGTSSAPVSTCRS